MIITCCCLTCIVCEENTEETSRLLHNEDKSEGHPPVRDKQPNYSRSTSAVSSASSLRGLSTESGEPTSEPQKGDVGTKDKFSKAVGVIKKYNVMPSKYNTRELHRQLSSPAKLRLKIGIKIMQRTSSVKVSVIEAHDVMPIMQAKGLPDLSASTDQEQPMVVQIRTKIVHSDVRGHTRKYEIHGGVTGALKLRSETLHTIDLEEFLHCKIRFRLYFVSKHQRDKLLGEYTLDVASLDVDTNIPITYSMLELADPTLSESDTSTQSPEVLPVLSRVLSSDSSQPNKMLSTDSQPSTDKEPESLPMPKIQRQAKIRSQDSVKRGQEKDTPECSLSPDRSEEETTPKRSISKAFKSIRHGAALVLSKDHGSKDKESSIDLAEPTAPSTEQMTINERLRMAAKERSEKVEELEESTAAMADTAGNFSALSVRLKEKYMTQSGKKRKSSET